MTFCQNSHKMRKKAMEVECDMIFQNNKKAWIVFAVTVIAVIPAYFILRQETEIFVFPAVQAALLILGSLESVKTWCMNYKMSVMRSEHQYYFMLFLGVLLMLFVGIGYFYTTYTELAGVS